MYDCTWAMEGVKGVYSKLINKPMFLLHFSIGLTIWVLQSSLKEMLIPRSLIMMDLKTELSVIHKAITFKINMT